MIGIYKIQSKIKPNRVYIGSAVNLKNRKSGHFSQLKKNIHDNKKLQNHSNKYGVEDLSFYVLEFLNDKDILLEREQYYIDLYSPFFNICPIAKSRLGVKLSQDSKDKISNSKKGVKHHPDCFEAKSKRQKGKQNALGFKHSEIAKANIRLNNPRLRAVYQYDMGGVFIKKWDCCMDASRILKIDSNSIYRCAKGFLNTAGKFKWKYE